MYIQYIIIKTNEDTAGSLTGHEYLVFPPPQTAQEAGDEEEDGQD